LTNLHIADEVAGLDACAALVGAAVPPVACILDAGYEVVGNVCVRCRWSTNSYICD